MVNRYVMKSEHDLFFDCLPYEWRSGTNDGMCHNKMERWKFHDSISCNGYVNAIIGRYGGCFEEDIRRLMCDRAYHITGFGCTKFAPTLEVRMAMHSIEEAIKLRKSESAYNPWTHISHKEVTYLLRKFISPRSQLLLHMPLGG